MSNNNSFVREESLEIDNQKVVAKITESLREAVEKRQVVGLLVIFSGQLDSYVTAKLAIEAVGTEATKLVILSDIDEKRRQAVVAQAKVNLKIPDQNFFVFNIRKIMQSFDSIELIPQLMAGLPLSKIENISRLLLKTHLIQKTTHEKTYLMVGKSKSEREKFIQELVATSKIKKRMKIVLAYLVAERENLLVVGKTDKTEYLTGIFTSFGYGHAADVMPLGDLYRTQVKSLARYLNVPEEIINEEAKMDIPDIHNKFKYFFELPASEVDRILVKIRAGYDTDTIAKTLSIDLEKVNRVKRFYEVSEFRRNVPFIPSITD